MGYLSKNPRQRLLRSAMTFLSMSVALQLHLTLIRLMDRFGQDMRNQFSVFAGKDYVQQVMPASGLGWEPFPSPSSSIQAETASELLQLAHVDSPSSTPTLFVQLVLPVIRMIPPQVLAVGIELGHESAFLGNIGLELQ